MKVSFIQFVANNHRPQIMGQTGRIADLGRVSDALHTQVRAPGQQPPSCLVLLDSHVLVANFNRAGTGTAAYETDQHAA